MDKRYQVFVSSTFEDLQEERKEVMQALLELDCIPAGMELFPASSEEQWSLIKRVIDDSDYYILIIGGRYGSVDSEGMGYTEKEYRYAIDTNKPVIAFIHKDPGSLRSDKTEQSETGKEKLLAFRVLAQKKLTKSWTNPSDLGSVISRSMIKLIKQFPAVGWVKADCILDEMSAKEILKLKKENELLKMKMVENKMSAPDGTEILAQAEDVIELTITYRAMGKEGNKRGKIRVQCTWNDLFTSISPYLIDECDEKKLKEVLVKYASNISKHDIREVKENKEYTKIWDLNILDTEFQRIKVQFKALGLIVQSVKNRSVKDTGNYWTLTDYGDYVMTKLIAIKK